MSLHRPAQVQRLLNQLAAVSVIVASASVIWAVLSVRARFDDPRPRLPQRAAGASNVQPKEPVSLADAALDGQDGVRVGVIGYSDFECPYCVRFAKDVLPRLRGTYLRTGKAFLAFRHLPLKRIHPVALPAAAAAECARQQGRFWEVHDALFAAGRPLKTFDLASVGTQYGLESKAFEVCRASTGIAIVNRDTAAAVKLGITGTPTFLFGVREEAGSFRVMRKETGAIPFDAFAAILDDLLREVKPTAQTR